MRTITDTTVLTPEHLAGVVEHFTRHDAFAFDVETVGPHRGVPTQNEVTWIGLATHGMTAVIPMGHPNGTDVLSKATRKKNALTQKMDIIPATYSPPPQQLRPGQVFSALAPLFFSERTKIAHNATFDLISVAKYFGEIPAPAYSDTIVLQWLLDENIINKGLKKLITKYFGHNYDAENVGKRVEAFDFAKVARYQFLDAKYTWLLYKDFTRQIDAEGLAGIRDLEMDVLGVLLDMGVTGAYVDEDALHVLEEMLAARLVGVEAGIYRAAGKTFNLNAPAQKSEVLFAKTLDGGQGLRARGLTPGGTKKDKAGQALEWKDYSTDAAALGSLANEKNDVVSGILEYQEVSKIHGTYVQGYLGDPEDEKKPRRIFDGRVHADLVQYGTVTGRFSCREPNLQNIPRPDSDLGRQIRGLFIAPPGHKLIVADYGQIELVVLAHFIKSGRLYDGFHAGIDPHSATAAALIGQDPAVFAQRVKDGDEAAKGLRQAGKGINFAVVYGAGPDKVAAMASINTPQAKRFMAIHEEQFPEIYRFKAKVIEVARSRRPAHIRTLLGRRRRLPTLFSPDRAERGKAERQAVNSLIQGSAADLLKYAMVRLNNSLGEGMALSLSVHDELVTIARDDVVDAAVDAVREAMLGEGMAKLVRVPLSTDIKVVDRWSDAK